MLRNEIVRACVVSIVGLVVPAATIHAQQTVRVMGGTVTVLCPLTVGGSFEAKTKALTGHVAVGAEEPRSTVGDGQSPGSGGPAIGTAGRSTDVTNGEALSVAGEILVDLTTLETGIGLRDRHLRSRFLEVERGPAFAVARLQNIRVERLPGKGSFRGVLMVHGEQNEVIGTAHIKPDGSGYRLEATFPLRVSDFGISEPTYLGVGVKDELTVRVNLSAVPAAGASATRQ